MARLKEFEWPKQKRGVRATHSLRTVKVIKATCDTCDRYPGWENNCPHDPWHVLMPVKVLTNVRDVDPGTGLVVEVRQEETITHYKHLPNVDQVALTLRINSGFGLQKALGRGARLPQDVQPTLPHGEPDPDFDGYAPMCEFQNCYASNPTVRARHVGLAENAMIPASYQMGYYCSEHHARLAKQRDTERAVREVGDPTKRAEQLAAVALP